MPKTKRGIYHNLKESKYTISNGEVVFFFSSLFYLEKFMECYQENRLKPKYRRIEKETKLNLNMLADIVLYREIERRGFRVKIRNVEVDWNELNKYALRKMVDDATYDWKIYRTKKLGVHYG